MKEARVVSSTDARNQFSEIVNKAAFADEPTIIKKNGRKQVVVVPYKVFELFERIEAVLDLQKAERAFAEYERNGGCTLEELKSELGIK